MTYQMFITAGSRMRKRKKNKEEEIKKHKFFKAGFRKKFNLKGFVFLLSYG